MPSIINDSVLAARRKQWRTDEAAGNRTDESRKEQEFDRRISMKLQPYIGRDAFDIRTMIADAEKLGIVIQEVVDDVLKSMKHDSAALPTITADFILAEYQRTGLDPGLFSPVDVLAFDAGLHDVDAADTDRQYQHVRERHHVTQDFVEGLLGGYEGWEFHPDHSAEPAGQQDYTTGFKISASLAKKLRKKS